MLVSDVNNGELLLFDNGVYLNLQDTIKDSGIGGPQNLFINNNGIIIGTCSIWGESHVFMLRPEKK